MKQLKTILVAVALTAGLGTALAQPANDNFDARTIITGANISFNGTTALATKEAGEPNHANNGGGKSVWYEWTPTATASVTITSDGSPGGFRTLLAAYPGSAVNNLGAALDTAIEGNFGNAVLQFTAQAGVSYKIVVDTRNNVTGGTFAFTLAQAVPVPTVNLTAPLNGQSFTNPATVTLTAAATPVSGSITNVSFYRNGNTLIGTVTSGPFSLVWSNIPEGTYTVTARATDTTGQTGVSPDVNIAVRPPGYFAYTLIGSNNITGTNSWWRYLDDGSDQGTLWSQWGFNDSTWAAGPGQLGYGDGDEATVVNSGPVGNAFITTYFRHAFTVTNQADITNLVARFLRDDAVVGYLNGVEVLRDNIDVGQNYLTLVNNAGDDGQTFITAAIPANLLTNGVNVFAAEIHQTGPTSSDITWYLELLADGAGPANPPPAVAITVPAPGASYFNPASIAITAAASDTNGTVTNVQFYADGTLLGARTAAPYSLLWTGPTLGFHTLIVRATDNEGAATTAQNDIYVYDALGTPLGQITLPAADQVFDGPTNLALTAQASATTTITNVQFVANGTVIIGNDTTAPYALVWTNATFGTNFLTVIVTDAANKRGTSAPVRVIITTPPPNLAAPTLASRTPAPGATVGSLATVSVTFSERVIGVDAADLLINGVPATSVSGTDSNYTFTVTAPPLGPVNVTWAANHGIEDVGYPPLPYAASGWSFTLADLTPPVIVARTPVAGATVTNLASVQVSFSETVQGVDASDLLVNGSPAIGLSGAGASYTFTFAQPAPGPVNITWSGGHAIADTAANPFNATGPGATWSYTLDLRTILVQSNANWGFLKGLAEASTPDTTAWRQLAYNDAAWSNAPAPFYYGDPYNSASAPGTLLSDMQAGYSSIYLRSKFVVSGASALTNLYLVAQSDDGFIAWINGVEVVRYNMSPGEIPYNGSAPAATTEPNNTGAAYLEYTLAGADSYLVEGTNVLTIHAFNNSPTTSSDFGFNAQLYTFAANLGAVPPRLAALTPPAGNVLDLTSLTLTFSEPVTGVNAADLLINGLPATGLIPGPNGTAASNATWTFTFAQPAYGAVAITWAASPGIQDFDTPAKPFDPAAPGATFAYNLQNPAAPVIQAQTPAAGATLATLAQLTVYFSKPVTGVDAADLHLGGLPATGLTGSGAGPYTFIFPQPPYGDVTISWAANSGIQDTAPAPNAFDPLRASSTWTYTLVDQTPPTIFAKNPPAGANVTNLTLLTVTFSEPVLGVNASDLLINNIPAINLGGSGTNYTFVFTRPNTSVVNFNWALNHGITDIVGNPFDPVGPGATWQYFTPDSVPPVVAAITPPPNATVRNLTQVAVTFSEPVTGVAPGSLRINNVAATAVAGSAAGPYTFTFASPATGAVEIIWAPANGITDLASPPNNFVGGEWNYVLNPNAVFTDKVVINEIMFLPASASTNDEWLELKNTDTAPLNLNGWRLSKGVSYTFPNVTIPAGGYLVIAANLTSFNTRYPGVTNVLGPWTGNLANNGETIQLETALGETVNEVTYASEGDWATRIRGPLDNNHRGWTWRSPAGEASGPALELMNPALPNKYGRNWRSSIATNGTPGAVNSVASTNIPPLILDLAHFPPVPRSTDPVVVTARLLDERTNGLAVTLFYRDASTITPPAFTALTMFDDGAHNDGVAGDKYYAATVPAQPSGTVIEFYVQAVDLDDQTNTWPAAAYDQNNIPGQFANALYQVDDTVYAFPQPLYKIIMTETERRERRQIETGDSQSNAEMNGSLLTIDGTGTEVRYNIGLRERGAGSRGSVPANQRVNVPNDRRWKGVREFNLNTRFTESQYAGYLLSRKSGLDTEYARIVRVTINNTNNANAGSPQYGCYIHVEAPDSDMATEHWPLDDAGNLYRCTRPNTDLRVLTPPTAQSYINQGYLKSTNSRENDYSDLTNLTYVLNLVPDAEYPAAVRATLNVEQWMLYFAVNSLLENSETALGSGVGDDYGLYRGVKDARFQVVAHDWDTVLNRGDNGGNVNENIFVAAALPAINRFMHWPEFEPIYYATLRHLCQTIFAPAELGRTLDEGLSDFVPTATITAMKTFASNRVNYILSQLPADPDALNVAATNIGGTISANTVFASSNPNYFITSALTIANGATLTIQPGVTVRLASGANITVANGGRLLAEGTAAAPILFTRSTGANWGHIIINGAVGSPESRITHARLEFNATSTGTPAIDVAGGTAVLDYLTFGNTASPYIHVDNASFVISHCEFPTITASFEPVHGNGAVKAGGRGLFYRNWFGKTIGYNDTIDFTGGNRPGSPIVQFLDNVFTGSQDDILDIDGTDAWVEGNIFIGSHRVGSPDSSSAVSGGNDSGQTSEITVINNIFFDCDQAATAKQGNFYTFVNNTVVHQSSAGFDDAGVGAALNFADEGIAAAAGGYVEGNIFYDIERLTRNVTNGTALAGAITFNGNLMPVAWFGPGTNNSTGNPLFQHVPGVGETAGFTNWAAAQFMRAWLSLQPGSPGIGSGPNGSDRGGVVPLGATVSVHDGATANDAVLVVGINRTGNSIPAGGFPNGSGYTHYRWRLDGGAWSGETPVASVISLPGFKSGAHRVEVSGRRDSGMYQDDADWGELALPTTVCSGVAQKIVLNEVLASNQGAVDHEGTHPDVVELYNPGATAVDVSGLRLSDDAANPDKFVFPAGTVLSAGGYLVVYANGADGTSGLHAGFSLNKDGQSLYLYDTVDNGGVLIDAVTFGLQLTDFSVGRVGTNWVLCVPTAGGPNVPAATGSPQGLVINEVLAAELTAFPDDFVELYNPGAWPVALGGLFFTDNPPHWPDRSAVPALTYIAAGGYIAFHADGKTSKGADHLDFSLEAERGVVALLNTDYAVIDCVIYGPQTTDVSQGRVASNIYDNNFFTTPTPGAPNPGVISTNSGVVLNEILAANGTVLEADGSTPDWIELYNLSATSVDLGDYSLSDAAVNPRQYVFAAGTIIAGNGYLRLRCDGSLPASSTNTGFNIKAEGGSVYLFDALANGGLLRNAVTYGLQAVDFSISRVPNGTGGWALTLPTPGGSSIPAASASATSVKINEWMAAPAAGEDWFELWNPNAQPVAIGGYYTTDDLNNRTKSQIPALSFLGASTNGYQRFWADSAPADGANHANFKFAAGGESIGFANPAGTLIDSVTFGAQAADVSEGRFPDGTATVARFPGTASPGDPNYLVLTNVIINEALTHTDPPLEDAIELRNLTAAPVNIGNWWLSDAKSVPRKYRIPNGTTIPANGYAVFYEYQFNSDPTNDPTHSFSLSSAKGDEVYLSTGDAAGNLTGYRTSVDFKAAQNGVSFGRYVTSDGREEFVAMSARSLGQDDPGNLAVFRTGTGLANPYPRVGPVVISQIMYHPPDVGTNDNTLDEFIELRNITNAPAPLYDPLAATNTWRLRDGVDYDFPQGVSLPVGGKLLVVSFDPANNPAQLASFRAKYGIDVAVPVYGPYTGKLANSDDKVELYKPDNPDAGFVPYVLADRAHYYDAAPWPAAADGGGASLQRLSLTGFGNDPTNWAAALPNFGGVVDSDGDGLPDVWEVQYGLNPNNPADANQDLDGDGLTNLQEYLAGTAPNNAGSALRIVPVEYAGGNNVRLYFVAVSNRTYTVEFKNALTDLTWSRLTDISAAATNRTIPILTAVPGGGRYYRVRTPQLP